MLSAIAIAAATVAVAAAAVAATAAHKKVAIAAIAAARRAALLINDDGQTGGRFHNDVNQFSNRLIGGVLRHFSIENAPKE